MKNPIASRLVWFRSLPASGRTLLILLALCAGGLALSWMARPTIRVGQRPSPDTSSFVPVAPRNEPDAQWKAQWERIKQAEKTSRSAPVDAVGESMGAPIGESGYPTPMIAHAAELTVSTKEFAHSRSTLEEILDRHHGYAAKLRMVGETNSSSLTATLRVPSSEFTAAANDLKALGKVEREEQTADELTQQRADLEARLVNAQNALERLQAILDKGGKIHNPLEVQRQLRNASAEISRLEAERVRSEHQVIFAQVLFSLREEVKPPATSIAAEFQSAALAGLSDALGSLSAILLFLISRGPVTLLWIVLVFFPSRWMWRKWHPRGEARPGEPQGASAA